MKAGSQLEPRLGKRMEGPGDDEKQFHQWLAVLARATNTQLETMLIAAYDHRLSPLGYSNVISAIKDILADRRPNDPFPSAREIADRISKPEDDKHVVYLTAYKEYHEHAGLIIRIDPL